MSERAMNVAWYRFVSTFAREVEWIPVNRSTRRSRRRYRIGVHGDGEAHAVLVLDIPRKH